MKEARSWYADHLKLQPLERVGHEPTPSSMLRDPKWTRLERRSSTLLLMALPQSLREELVASKRLGALCIICHLMTLFQPGGLAEKELILKQLESPAEANSISEAVQGLRRWTRWRHRANDLGLQQPDAFPSPQGPEPNHKKAFRAEQGPLLSHFLGTVDFAGGCYSNIFDDNLICSSLVGGV